MMLVTMMLLPLGINHISHLPLGINHTFTHYYDADTDADEDDDDADDANDAVTS